MTIPDVQRIAHLISEPYSLFSKLCIRKLYISEE